MPVTSPLKRTAIGQARRRQLVDAAIAEIATSGFDDASTVRIARRAGVSRGVLTHHFTDREDLIDAVVAEVYELGRAEVGPEVEAAAGPRAAILAFVGASVDLYAAHPGEMTALTEIFAARARPGTDGREGEALHTREIEDVAALLRDGIARRELRRFDPLTMAVLIRSMLDGARRLVRAGADPKALRVETVAAIDAAIRKETA